MTESSQCRRQSQRQRQRQLRRRVGKAEAEKVAVVQEEEEESKLPRVNQAAQRARRIGQRNVRRKTNAEAAPNVHQT